MTDEIVLIVDARNREVGTATRAQMRRANLIHRATYVLVFNSRGELFVHQRTAGKDIYPAHYDIAAGGVLLAGESYEESARRELAEELGVVDVALTDRGEYYFADTNNRVWGRIYSCVYDGPLTLQKEEVQEGSFMSVAAVRQLARTKPFTPDGLLVLARLEDWQ